MISKGSFHHVSAWYAFLSIQHSPQANGFLVVMYGSSMLLLFRKKVFIICVFFLISLPRDLNIVTEIQHPTVFLQSFVKKGMVPPPAGSVKASTYFLASLL